MPLFKKKCPFLDREWAHFKTKLRHLQFGNQTNPWMQYATHTQVSWLCALPSRVVCRCHLCIKEIEVISSFTNTGSFVDIDPGSFRSLSIQRPRKDLLQLIVPLSEKYKKSLIIFHLRPEAALLAMPRKRPRQEQTRKRRKDLYECS